MERYKAGPGTLIWEVQGTVPTWIWALMWAERCWGIHGGPGVGVMSGQWGSGCPVHGDIKDWYFWRAVMDVGLSLVLKICLRTCPDLHGPVHYSSCSFLLLPRLINPHLQWAEWPQYYHAAPYPNSQKHDGFSCVPVLPKSLGQDNKASAFNSTSAWKAKLVLQKVMLLTDRSLLWYQWKQNFPKVNSNLLADIHLICSWWYSSRMTLSMLSSFSI